RGVGYATVFVADRVIAEVRSAELGHDGEHQPAPNPRFVGAQPGDATGCSSCQEQTGERHQHDTEVGPPELRADGGDSQESGADDAKGDAVGGRPGGGGPPVRLPLRARLLGWWTGPVVVTASRAVAVVTGVVAGAGSLGVAAVAFAGRVLPGRSCPFPCLLSAGGV